MIKPWHLVVGCFHVIFYFRKVAAPIAFIVMNSSFKFKIADYFA